LAWAPRGALPRGNREHHRGETMAKPNYGFAKRQRELEKKRKKEEKAQKKESPQEAQQEAPGEEPVLAQPESQPQPGQQAE
jgi:hypothetical protein